MDQISDKVFLGNLQSADEENLIENNIKRVLSCLGCFSPKYKNEAITQKIFDINDGPKSNIIKYFKEAIKFIDESEKVLVHCLGGISRSATIVIAYFMWKNRITFEESFEFLLDHRVVGPNEGFRKQLLIFQDKLKENNYDLDKIDFQNIEWPPKEGSKYYFEDL